MSNLVLDDPLWHEEFVYFSEVYCIWVYCRQKNKNQVKLELLDCKIVWLIFLMAPRRTDLSSELLEQ